MRSVRHILNYFYSVSEARAGADRVAQSACTPPQFESKLVTGLTSYFGDIKG